MFEFEVSPEFLLVVIAGLLAFFFDYFPVVAKWFDALEESQKKLLTAGLVTLVGIVIFGGQCFNLFTTNLICSTKGFFDTLYIVFLALGVNYGVHKATKPNEGLKRKMFGQG